MRKFLFISLKRASYVAMFLVTALMSHSFFSSQNIKNDSYSLSNKVPRAHADVPYSQSSYYSQGGYGGGGDDSGGDADGGGGDDCDGGDDDGDCDDA